MRIMRSRQPALPASPHPLMRVAATTSASPHRAGNGPIFDIATALPAVTTAPNTGDVIAGALA